VLGVDVIVVSVRKGVLLRRVGAPRHPRPPPDTSKRDHPLGKSPTNRPKGREKLLTGPPPRPPLRGRPDAVVREVRGS